MRRFCIEIPYELGNLRAPMLRSRQVMSADFGRHLSRRVASAARRNRHGGSVHKG